VKKQIILILCVFLGTFIFGVDLVKVDQMDREGKYVEALALLTEGFDKAKPDPKLVWRISRENFEIIDKQKNISKKEKIDKFTENLNFIKPFFSLKNAEKSDLAKIYYYYAVVLGSRGKVIGIKESIGIIPDLYHLASLAIDLDPGYTGSYLMVAKVDEALSPYMVMGGDYYRMGINFMKAMETGPETIINYHDAAIAFLARNWDVNKKKQETESWNKRKISISVKSEKKDKLTEAEKKRLLKDYELGCTTDLTPQDASDKDFAVELFKKAVKIYEQKKEPTARDTREYKDSIVQLKKLKH